MDVQGRALFFRLCSRMKRDCEGWTMHCVKKICFHNPTESDSVFVFVFEHLIENVIGGCINYPLFSLSRLYCNFYQFQFIGTHFNIQFLSASALYVNGSGSETDVGKRNGINSRDYRLPLGKRSSHSSSNNFTYNVGRGYIGKNVFL